MRDVTGPESFDAVVLPHLDAGRRLARWLMRNDDDADDVVQEASLRALRYFHTYSGGNARAWFLRIVRNTCRSWRGEGGDARTAPFDEGLHSGVHPTPNPETLLLRSEDAALIKRAMSDLPGRHRELLVSRELEGLSYQEMADAMSIPVGTVMSGLSRARQAFRGALQRSSLDYLATSFRPEEIRRAYESREIRDRGSKPEDRRCDSPD